MSKENSARPVSLFAWPPSPALLSLHLLARGILLLIDVIGLSILFAIGSQLGQASGFVGGSFFVVSFIVTPFFMLWNRRLLKRVRKLQNKDQDVDQSPPKFRTKLLKFVMFVDGLGAIAMFSAFFPVVLDAGKNYWWNRPSGAQRLTFAYGSFSILCATIIHFLLFLTEACQLHSSSRIPKEKKIVCPHCSHTMTRVSTSEVYRTPPESTMGANNDDMLVDGLVDTRISMNPGQETGTTFKTPRQSEHQNRVTGSAPQEGEANEAGEGEQDTLISKTG